MLGSDSCLLARHLLPEVEVTRWRVVGHQVAAQQ